MNLPWEFQPDLLRESSNRFQNFRSSQYIFVDILIDIIVEKNNNKESTGNKLEQKPRKKVLATEIESKGKNQDPKHYSDIYLLGPLVGQYDNTPV